MAEFCEQMRTELTDQPKLSDNPRPTAAVVVKAATLEILQVNPAACQLLCLTEAALTGMLFTVFIATDHDQKSLLTTVGLLETDLLACNPQLELPLQRRDDFIFQAEIIMMAVMGDGAEKKIVLSIHDVTSKKVTNEQLWAEAQAASYRHLVEGIGDGLLELDGDGDILFANKSAERILHRSRCDIIGKNFMSLAHSLVPTGEQKTFLEHMSDKFNRPIFSPMYLDGSARQFEFHFYPHRNGIGVIFCDISERLVQEIEIAKLTTTMAAHQELLKSKNIALNDSLGQMEKLNDQLQQTDRLKNEFLSNTSHELRTPLNSIIGFLQLIGEGLCENREEELEYISNALASAQHLLAMINDILDVAKIQAGHITLFVDEVDARGLLQEVYQAALPRSREQGLRLIMDLAEEDQAKLSVRADYHKTKHILLHLVNNAIKFTLDGEVVIKAAPDTERADMMRFSIKDTGIGIDPDQQSLIFEKFIQIDGTSTRKYEGTGLGLALTRHLVEMMGGEIQVHSAGHNQGTTMAFTLPIGGGASHESQGTASSGSTEEPLPWAF